MPKVPRTLEPWHSAFSIDSQAVFFAGLLKNQGAIEMLKRLLLVVVLVVAVLTGYAVGQSDVKPSGGPVFSGGEFGFQADEPLGDIMKHGGGSVTGKFVVNVNGRWVEARLRSGIVPVR